MGHWESSIEKQIREAMEAGKFDNLPGRGKPLDLSENPFEDPDLRTAHRLLREAGFAPAFIEERKAIDSELEHVRTGLVRAWRLYKSAGKTGLKDQDVIWQRVQSEFRQTVLDLNSRIRLHNLKVPAGIFQRNVIDVEQQIERAKSVDGLELE
jgi:DnaJ homolog subfamily C member 28